MKKSEEILKKVDELIEIPFVTARFGNHWKEHAEKNLDKTNVIDIAWKQGRRAILLEEALKQILGEE